MAYLITCSGSKQNPTIINPSHLQDLSFNNELLEARQEMIHLYNQNLDWNRCLPAWQLYTGNRSKLYPQVSEDNWLKPNADIMILSALLGWIKHTDLITNYNLRMDEKIDGIFVWRRWRNFNLLQQSVGETDIDLLSGNYRKAINYNGNNIPQLPDEHFTDRGVQKGRWLNRQLNIL